ncbi:MAG TPA: type II toxin-antitoxin system VapC family toxin [Nitrosopumilus sp.]|nr:type II toxin-antitoxin system VapC family toxin [Nitrosopumilus sp.]
MNQAQSIALDSCVVIDILEKPKVASGLKARLRGKSVKIILCDVVLREVKRVRGYLAEQVIAKLTSLLGRKIEILSVEESEISNAQQITNQFQICHNGDNKILSLCQAKDFVLVTFDRMLLKACSFVGVAAFHPSMVGGI